MTTRSRPPKRAQADTIEAYAEMRAELDRGAENRGSLLARWGFDEESWAKFEDRWQDALSAAMDVGDDASQGEVLSRFSAAYAAAQANHAAPMSLEQLAEATRLLGVYGDVQRVMAHLGVQLADYLHANQVWTHRMTREPAVADRFRALLDDKGEPTSSSER